MMIDDAIKFDEEVPEKLSNLKSFVIPCIIDSIPFKEVACD
jgi:hypothetical protein